MSRITLPADYRRRLLERFLRYVSIDTQSNDGAPEALSPTTIGQLDFADSLLTELRDLGFDSACASVDPFGYVYAVLAENLLPNHPAHGRVPVIGLNAHLDTASEASGANVRPRVFWAYDGRDISYPDNPELVLHYAHNPALKDCLGHTIITASGLTLLGADDKAGIAEIVTVLEYLIRENIPHGEVRVCFSPDEEQGRGMAHLDLTRFPVRYAYTLDGNREGEIESECFNAVTARVSIKGRASHPGSAKGKMTNAIRVGAWFIDNLPWYALPETTSGRQPFIHAGSCPTVPSVESFEVDLLLRAFTDAELDQLKTWMTEHCQKAERQFEGARVTLTFKDGYRNMRAAIDQHPQVMGLLEEACRIQGVTVRHEPIRGGTDGATLTNDYGIPTPNIWAGGMNLHGPLEWASFDWMVSATETVITLLGLWVERAAQEEK